MNELAASPREPFAYRQDPGVAAFDDSQPIVIFDGACVICSTFVRFLLRRDRHKRLRFLAAQTPLGQALYGHFQLERTDFSTYVLLADGIAHVKSDAALKLFALLGLPWSVLSIGRVVPRFLRDAVYDFVARNRFAWFGRRAICYAPSAEEAERFVA